MTIISLKRKFDLFLEMEKLFSPFAENIMQTSEKLARRFGCDYIDSEHIFLAIIDESLKNANGENLVIKILKHLNINLFNLIEDVESSFNGNGKAITTDKIPLTKIAELVLKISYLESEIFNSNTISPVHILLAYLRVGSAFSKGKLYAKYNLSYDQVNNCINLLA